MSLMFSKTFKDLVTSNHDTIGLCWVAKALNLNASSVEYLTFHFVNHTFSTIYVDPFLEISTKSFKMSSTT
jgi:hypothetical protein